DFYVCRQFLDATLSFASLVQVGAGDGDTAVIANVDLSAGFFGQSPDGCTTLANHATDLLGVDLQGQHARCELGQLGTGAFDRLTHCFENMQTAFAGLTQRDLHDFLGDALDLDIHLQGSDTVNSTCYLEIHVAQVIFVAQDVCQHGELATVFDQTHGNAGHVLRHRNTCVHHGKAATADRSHG